MDQVEVVAKTVEEARQMAAEQLGVSPDEVEVQVADTPRRLLGLIGGGHVRVTAWVRGHAPAEGMIESDDPCHCEGGVPAPDCRCEESADDTDAAQDAGPELVARRAAESCQKILDLIGLPAQAEIAAVRDREVVIELKGEGLGLLIGRYGATLEALQLIVAIIANRDLRDGARVTIDAEDYRKRREEALERLAHSQAEEAKRTGKEVVIPDLKAFERRVVHTALADDPEVQTYSEGEGDMRQLVISPTNTSGSGDDVEETDEPGDED